MQRKIIFTEDAPQAIGTYSQAVWRDRTRRNLTTRGPLQTEGWSNPVGGGDVVARRQREM